MDNKKLVFEYMGWENTWTRDYYKCHSLNATDMVAAMNKMVEKMEWRSFDNYGWNVYVNDTVDKKETFTSYIMQPERFFKLMVEWMEVKG